MAVTYHKQKFLIINMVVYTFNLLLCTSNESWGGNADVNKTTEENASTANYLQKTIPLNNQILGLYSIFNSTKLISKYSIRASKYGFIPQSTKNDESIVTCFNCGVNLNLESSEDADKLNTYSENCHTTLPDGQMCVYAAMSEPHTGTIFLTRDQIVIWYQISINFGQFKGINFTINMVDYDTKIKFIDDNYFKEIKETRKSTSPIGITRHTSISENASTVASASGFTDTSRGCNANSSTAQQIENSVTRSSYEPTFGNCVNDKTQLMSLNFNSISTQNNHDQKYNYAKTFPKIFRALKDMSYSDEQISAAIRFKLMSGFLIYDNIRDLTIEMLMSTININETNTTFNSPVCSNEIPETVLQKRRRKTQSQKYAQAYNRLIKENICTDTEVIYSAIQALETENNSLSDSNSNYFIDTILNKITQQTIINSVANKEICGETQNTEQQNNENTTLPCTLPNNNHLQMSQRTMSASFQEGKEIETSLNQKENQEEEEKRLANENKEMDQMLKCKICLDARCTICFIPCGHIVTCSACAEKIRRCALCRAYIKSTITIKD